MNLLSRLRRRPAIHLCLFPTHAEAKAWMAEHPDIETTRLWWTAPGFEGQHAHTAAGPMVLVWPEAGGK